MDNDVDDKAPWDGERERGKLCLG